jgi:hypothetical protein
VWKASQREKKLMNYQIRIREHLDLSWQDWFAGLQILHEPSGTTLLSGPLPDQAALFGVLLKISRLGLILLSLEILEDAESQAHRIQDAE